MFPLQSDVDNDLVGDSCDTNQDRYGMSPNCIGPDEKSRGSFLSQSFLLLPCFGGSLGRLSC